MMKKAFVFVLLVCLFSSFSSSAQTATNGAAGVILQDESRR